MTCIKRREFLYQGARTTAAITLLGALGSKAHGFQQSPDASIEEFLSYSGNFSISGIELRHLGKLKEIYAARNFAPLWSVNGTATTTSMEITRKLLNSNSVGLEPTKYYGRLLYQLAANQDSGQFLKYELLLTDSLYTYFGDLAHGALAQPSRKAGWRLEQSNIDVSGISNNFFNGESSYRQTIDQLQPSHPRYRSLLNALENHQAILAKGGWQQVPGGKSLQLGDRDPRTAMLRERLIASSDIKYSGYFDINEFDSMVESGVIEFQKRHGLEADGVVGPKTLQEINVPIQERITQLQTNIDRWRWLPRELGYSNITVNTAGYDMELVVNGGTAARMKVIVGTRKNKTPLFSDTMEHLVFNPSWYVPKSIIRELLPKEMEQPGWFDKNNFEVTSASSGTPVSPSSVNLDEDYFVSNYRVRQRPSEKNALGKLKFMFPNQYNIYLHDTNAKSLFDKSQRAFSHGCVRLEKPRELAKVLLEADGRSHAEIDSYLIHENTKKVVLNSPLPVHITYQTAWVDDSGNTHFRDDIYHHDRHARQQILNSKPIYAEAELKALASTGLTLVSNTY